MALVYCTNCGKKVSDTAPVCPHCGAANLFVKNGNTPPQQVPAPGYQMPMQPQNQNKKSHTGLIVVIIVAAVLCIIAAVVVPIIIGTQSSNNGTAERIPTQQSSRATRTSTTVVYSSSESESSRSYQTSRSTTSSQPYYEYEVPSVAPEKNTCIVNFAIDFDTHIWQEKYNVDVFLNGYLIKTLAGGNKNVQHFSAEVSKGILEITFQKAGATKPTFTFQEYVTGDTNFSYTLERCTGVPGVDDNYIKVTDNNA